MQDSLKSIIAKYTDALIADIHPKTKLEALDFDPEKFKEMCEELSETYEVLIDDEVTVTWKRVGHIRDYIEENSCKY